MNSNILNIKKVWSCRKLIFKTCGISAIIGLIIGFSTPKEYTAQIFIAPESTVRRPSSGINALTVMAGVSSNSSADRDAIYPSLYPQIIKSTPFLRGLSEIKVHTQRDTAAITLSRYLKERQKLPWWSISSIFQLTQEKASMAGAIASRINVGVDKKKRTITLFATMQDPLVAATVVDTISVHLRKYITEYRTNKARKILKYYEELCQEAQVEYYTAQEKYTLYADANQDLVMLTSRAELARLRNEMNLAYNTYTQMKLQVQAAQAKVEKVTPVYAVIQPVVVPLTPSKPRKMLILTGCILLGAAGSIGWILFVKDFIEKFKNGTRLLDSRTSHPDGR